jgi:hypothetical protein
MAILNVSGLFGSRGGLCGRTVPGEAADFVSRVSRGAGVYGPFGPNRTPPERGFVSRDGAAGGDSPGVGKVVALGFAAGT